MTDATEVPRSATHVLSVGDRSVTLAGVLPGALRLRAVDAPDDQATREPADLIISHTDGGLVVQHRALDAHRQAVGDGLDLAEEVWTGAIDLVVARDRARWHVRASAVEAHGRAVLLIGGAEHRRAVSDALVEAGGRPLARDLVTFWPGLRTGIGDGDPWTGAGDRAPTGTPTDGRLVADVVVYLDAGPAGDPEDDVRALHRAEAVQRLAGASPDLAALLGGALPSLLAVVAGATTVHLREPDAGLAAEVIAELHPPASRAPTWCGAGSVRSGTLTGWVDGAGLVHDPGAGTIEVVGDVSDDPEFRPSSPAPSLALGLVDGPRPWLGAVPPTATSPNLGPVADALVARASHGEELVLVGDLADASSGWCPDGWVPWAAPVAVLARSGSPNETSWGDDLVTVTTAEQLGLPEDAADEMHASAIPVLLTPGRWALRLHPTHRFLVACATARADRPESLRAVAANAPADPAGMESAFTCADRWGLRGVVDDAIRQTAASLGGIPEIWHRHFYGRPWRR